MATKRQRDIKKQAKKKKKEVEKAKKQMVETVYVDGIVREVRKTQRFSMRGLPVELQEAATRFARDYESAFEALSAPANEMKVDGGKPHQVHMARLAAQERMSGVKRLVGEADYTIIEAAIIFGANVESLNRGSGTHKIDIGGRIRNILRRMSEFYSGVRPRDKVLEAAQEIIAAAMGGSDRATLEAERAFMFAVKESERDTGKRRAA